MKKILAAVLCLVLMLSLCGCGEEKTSDTNIKTVNRNDIEYTIDTKERTIRDDQQVYSYTIDASGTTIIYPDGKSFTWKESNGISTGIASLDFDYSVHTDPMILLDVIDSAYHTKNGSSHDNAGLGAVLIIVGIVDAIWSEKIWFLNWGWRYKNAEPSDFALGLYRVGGIIAVIVGLVLIII